MNTDSCVSVTPVIAPVVGRIAELERLGDQIAELSAHLDAATARLLDLIREFDARGGWATASPRAPRGSRGASASIPVPRVSECGSREPSARCRGWRKPSLEASSRTRRSGRSLASRRPRPKRDCWRAAGRAPPSTSSESSAAGDGWIGSPKRGRPPSATAVARFTCIKTRTAW